MSLSKQAISFDRLGKTNFGTGSNTGNSLDNYIPRGVQIGLLIGIPAALATAAIGYYWWKTSPKSPSSKKNGSKSNNLSNGIPSAKIPPTISAQAAKKIAQDPSAPLYVQLKNEGNDFFRKGDYSSALDAYAKAMHESPPNSELALILQNRAAVFEKLGDWVQVINECTTALTLNPKYVKALSRRSKAYRFTGFDDEALEDVTGVCILEGFQNIKNVQLADEILKDIGKKEAERLLKEKTPTPPSKHNVDAFLRAFHCDPISKWWSDPKTVPILEGGDEGEEVKQHGFRGALNALLTRDYDNVIKLCSEELEIGSNDGPIADYVYLLRGTFRHLWGYQSEVVEDFRKVTDSKTATKEFKASAWVKIGAQVAMSENADFEEYFKKAEEIYPDCVDIYHQLGQILLTKGDFESAMVQINKANDVCPDFSLAAASKCYIEYRLASASENREKIEQSVKEFTRCLARFDNSPDVHNLYGQILMEMEKHKEALDQFDYVHKLDPNNAAIYVHKAVAQYQVDGNMDRALSILYDAVKVDDRSEFVYETIGTLELQAGNLDKAISSISKAITYAKTAQELMMLSSLKRAAEVQSKVKTKFGDVPGVGIPVPR